ncbi:hypothetical protein CQ14_06640 [Bradyrhizobium lablabi]|uniref:Uncharacterized protein n=1 Tax=Bradyrhizobium lablabi TaxID=722472 RepID=A0A0R3MMC5_9BRAD|nr:hypothetical protein [Bradyrhizobium lablabi]KRR21321.1 hypothetical protein CQ14_06640 [Bradyrhizobium lablabi]
MHHVPVKLTPEQAAIHRKAYLKNLHYSKPGDADIIRTYRHIEKGGLVIKALESIATAGVDELGLPKLAIARADQKVCHLSMHGNGGATMSPGGRTRRNSRRSQTSWFDFPAKTFPEKSGWRSAEAIVPLVPLSLRPKRALEAYHILFEADWRKAPPIDPFLLKRLSTHADLWLVVCAWDLTEVERAVLAGRV